MAEFRAENNEQMKYLLGELSENERVAVEERMFADEDFFADLLELENDLTDAFVRGGLSEFDGQRYEKSLEKFPERREKLANAAALREFIRLENEKGEVISAGFWEKIHSLFAVNSFATQAAFAALLLMMTIGAGYLLYDRYRLNQQLAELKKRQNIEQQSKENELENQLNQIREREKTLQAELSNSQTELDNKQTQTAELQAKIESEQAERQRLEAELADLRRKRETQIPESPKNKIAPPQTVFASVFLSSVSGGKGGGGGDIKYLEIGKDVSNIRLTLEIPAENTARKFSVDLNGAKVISNVNLRNGKTVVVSIPAKKFKFGGENRVTVKASDGGSFDYLLIVEKRK